MKLTIAFTLTMICFVAGSQSQTNNPGGGPEAYLDWNSSTIKRIGKQWRTKGKVGSRWSMRGLKTERAVNYKLRATLMSPEMIRAAARLEQLKNRLSNTQTKTLVNEAEKDTELVVMVELDPNEGSGVIPRDWRAVLQPKGLRLGAEGAVIGQKRPSLRKVKALKGVFRRNYDYDVFYVAFPLVDEEGNPLLAADVREIELVVGIYGREGRVSWRMPESIREKLKSLSKRKGVK